MHRRVIEPEALAQIACCVGDEGWTLAFPRELAHPPAVVWALLTDPERLRWWAPFTPDRSLDRCGAVAVTATGGHWADAVRVTVLRAEPPALLECAWPDDRLRWELDVTAAGTRVMLRHTFLAWEWAPELAAGWHLSFDAAQRLLDGTRDDGTCGAGGSGTAPAGSGQRYSWDDLFEAYADKLIHAGWHDVDAGGMPTRSRRS